MSICVFLALANVMHNQACLIAGNTSLSGLYVLPPPPPPPLPLFLFSFSFLSLLSFTLASIALLGPAHSHEVTLPCRHGCVMLIWRMGRQT